MPLPEPEWTLKPAPDKAAVDALLGVSRSIPQVIAGLLAQRGIAPEGVQAYFRPDMANLHSPFLMAGMREGVARLHAAITARERVMVLGDYDVDGTTATALFLGVLHGFLPDAVSYTPDRFTEGYGISDKALAFACAHGCTLIVCLDCGTKAVEAAAQAKADGIDMIIADHHLPGAEVPEVAALINPMQAGCPYPFKYLPGCAVGYKLWVAYYQHIGRDVAELDGYLDLVAIAICADVMPIVDENRVLVAMGLDQLNRYPRPGIKAMLEEAGQTEREGGGYGVDVSKVIFLIGPRINAAGRMEHGKLAVDLLLAPDADQAHALAAQLAEHNNNRRTADRIMAKEAEEQLKKLYGFKREAYENARTTVLADENWSKGLVGIAASRMVDIYPRPTVVLTRNEDLWVGSARSVEGADVYQALAACADLLADFGGHAYAAGVSLPLGNLEAFRTRFEQAVADSPCAPSKRKLEIDLALRPTDVDINLVQWLEKMAPFGQGNQRPVFISQNLYILPSQSRILNDRKSGEPAHMLLTLCAEGGTKLSAIGWRMGPQCEAMRSDPSTPLQAAYMLEGHTFKSSPATPRLVLQAIRAMG